LYSESCIDQHCRFLLACSFAHSVRLFVRVDDACGSCVLWLQMSSKLFIAALFAASLALAFSQPPQTTLLWNALYSNTACALDSGASSLQLYYPVVIGECIDRTIVRHISVRPSARHHYVICAVDVGQRGMATRRVQRLRLHRTSPLHHDDWQCTHALAPSVSIHKRSPTVVRGLRSLDARAFLSNRRTTGAAESLCLETRLCTG
jgi:hypothetical protein